MRPFSTGNMDTRLGERISSAPSELVGDAMIYASDSLRSLIQRGGVPDYILSLSEHSEAHIAGRPSLAVLLFILERCHEANVDNVAAIVDPLRDEIGEFAGPFFGSIAEAHGARDHEEAEAMGIVEQVIAEGDAELERRIAAGDGQALAYKIAQMFLHRFEDVQARAAYA